jgi:hypothetical protein
MPYCSVVWSRHFTPTCRLRRQGFKVREEFHKRLSSTNTYTASDKWQLDSKHSPPIGRCHITLFVNIATATGNVFLEQLFSNTFWHFPLCQQDRSKYLKGDRGHKCFLLLPFPLPLAQALQSFVDLDLQYNLPPLPTVSDHFLPILYSHYTEYVFKSSSTSSLHFCMVFLFSLASLSYHWYTVIT